MRLEHGVLIVDEKLVGVGGDLVGNCEDAELLAGIVEDLLKDSGPLGMPELQLATVYLPCLANGGVDDGIGAFAERRLSRDVDEALAVVFRDRHANASDTLDLKARVEVGTTAVAIERALGARAVVPVRISDIVQTLS